MGRPSKYDPKFAKQAYELSLLGAIDKQLADFFDVSVDTIHEWKKVHPEFSYALKEAKDYADAQVVKSLYQRATGYSHEEDKIFIDKGQAIIVPTRKHYPPDTLACIYWLNNRQSANWKNVKEDDGSREPIQMPVIVVKHKKKINE